MTLPSRFLSAIVLGATASAQSTWLVDASATAPGDGSPGSPFTTIQQGIDASATSGDTVRVLSGTYVENLVLDGRSVELTAASGLGSVMVDGSQTRPVLTVLNHPTGPITVVRGLRFQNGLGTQDAVGNTQGGGLFVPGPASTAFNSCEFTDNRANEGGGAFLNAGVHTFVGCAFDANFGDRGGGLYTAGTELVLQACSASDNQGLTPSTTFNIDWFGMGMALMPPATIGAPSATILIEDCQVNRNFNLGLTDGIGVYSHSGGSTLIRHTSITGNDQPPAGQFNALGGRGGGLHIDASTTLDQCEIRDNGQSLSAGGGVFGQGLARGCVIAGNSAAEGGGVAFGRYEDCLIEGNIAAGISSTEGAIGGGAQSATLNRCVLRSNRAVGGPVRVGGGANGSTLADCVVEFNSLDTSGNPFTEAGGGLHACDATDTLIRYNAAPAGGGAHNCRGFAGRLLRCTLIGNVAYESGGGAVDSRLENCVVRRNHSGGHGGGAVDSSLERCVISGNTANICAGTAGCNVDFCTVTGNRASGQVGGVGASDEFLPPHLGLLSRMSNSIVYANEPDNVGEATGNGPGNPTATAEWSIVQGGWPGTGNLDTDGLVAGPYSGNAQLLAGSPAIDSGDPAAPLDPDGSRADMGAIPFDPSFVPGPADFCVGKPSSLGVLPRLSWAGSPTLSGPDDFELLGTDLNGGSFALVALAPNPAATQAFGGTICLGSGLVRLGVIPTGGTLGSADGAVTLDLDQGALQSFGAGSLLYAQMLVRDPNNPDGSGAALTVGLEFRVLP